MLNKNNERELAYLVIVDAITPMNADRLECAHVGGWHCVVGKEEFKPGDLAVYFEIDSQLPDVEPFSSMEFLKSKNFKIKTQKIRGEYSQGLLMPVSAFGWTIEKIWNAETGTETIYVDNAKDGELYCLENDSRFLTKKLNVTYAEPVDNIRKSGGIDKYKLMAQRHPTIFKQKWARWLMKRNWGRKLMFLFFGKKKDKKNGWPSWVKPTDEERIQNCPWVLQGQTEWIATEKIDGSSTTFAIRGRGRKQQFFVCSRRAVFDKPDKKCFYDTNIYIEMEEKYHMQDLMKKMIDDSPCIPGPIAEYVTIQAETYGAGVQKRDYGLTGHDMAIFNIIFGYKDGSQYRLNPMEGQEYAARYNLPFVPVISARQTLPQTPEEVLEMADGKSVIDGGMREGIVFRSTDGTQSFKAVSNDFLIKYHQ